MNKLKTNVLQFSGADFNCKGKIVGLHYTNFDSFIKKESSDDYIKNESNKNDTNCVVLSQTSFTREGKLVKSSVKIPHCVQTNYESFGQLKATNTNCKDQQNKCQCSVQQNSPSEFVKLVHKVSKKSCKRRVEVLESGTNTDNEDFAHAYIDGTVDGFYSKSGQTSNVEAPSTKIKKTENKGLNFNESDSSTHSEQRRNSDVDISQQDAPSVDGQVKLVRGENKELNFNPVLRKKRKGNGLSVVEGSKIYFREVSQDIHDPYQLAVTISNDSSQ